ncbi:MAG: DUF4349 domain-containing protein [Bacillota bacterium]
MGEVTGKPRFTGWIFLIIGLLAGGMVVAAVFLAPRGMGSYAPQLSTSKVERAATVTKDIPVGSGKVTYGEAAGAGAATGSERLVIKRKTLRLAVKDVGTALAAVEELAVRNNGYIVSCVTSSPEGSPVEPLETRSDPCSGTIVVKVPAERFSAAIIEMKKLGKLESEQETSEEVTEQHIDLTARLKNLKRQEEQYLEILKSAKKVEEMLKVEEQLTRIRGEIESLQAQVDYLERSASMATITLELFEPASVATPLVRWGVKDSFVTALQGFVAVINFFIIAVGTVLPLLIVGFIVWLCLRARQKRRSTDA